MRDHLNIYLNGRAMRVEGADAFITLSDYLRKTQRLTGTKVVCAEGDCGACAVLIGRAGRYASVCSCIQLMFQLDGTHIVTVEGLCEAEGLNPIQEAMVKCHGAQCGFCTPGFIVSLHDLMQDGKPVRAEEIRRGLVGNLCRCTGYDSIIRAAMETDRSKLKKIDAVYPMAGDFAEGEVYIESGAMRFYKPDSVQNAVRFRQNNPDCMIVSGATDLGVQCNKGIRRLGTVLSTAGIGSICNISADAEGMTVGAGVTLTELQHAALRHLPELGRYLEWFGSPLIRNAGTLAGNLVNASPIGDTIPPLFVLDAVVEMTGPAGVRSVNINQFYTGYRRTVLAADELVTGVRIPLPKAGDVFKLYKVSKRKDLDISSFAAAIWMRQSGNVIEDIRIAYGGVAPTVIRLGKTEAFLRGNVASKELFEQAAVLARQEIRPISDVRGSEEYRRVLAGNILVKLWHEGAQ